MQCPARGHAQLFAANLSCLTSPAASRMSQLEGTRFIAQEGANQGLWGAGQCSQAVAQRSCLLAGPEAHQTRKEGGPGDAPYLHLQSLVLRSPILRTPQRGSKLSLPWNVLLPDHTDSTWPLHYCSFLSPICFPTWTTPYLASCSSSIYSAKHS